MQTQAISGTLSHDKGLIHRITTRLRSRSGRSITDFRIQIEEHGLVLWGRTHTYYSKQLAQMVAVEVSGLPIVANKIEVI